VIAATVADSLAVSVVVSLMGGVETVAGAAVGMVSSSSVQVVVTGFFRLAPSLHKLPILNIPDYGLPTVMRRRAQPLRESWKRASWISGVK